MTNPLLGRHVALTTGERVKYLVYIESPMRVRMDAVGKKMSTVQLSVSKQKCVCLNGNGIPYNQAKVASRQTWLAPS